MDYTIENYINGRVIAENGRYTYDMSYIDRRTWIVKIVFTTPVTGVLLQMIKDCLPVETYTINGDKIGWFTYEKITKTRRVGSVSLLNPTTVQVEFTDTQKTYSTHFSHQENPTPTYSPGKRQFLENLTEKFVSLSDQNWPVADPV